MLLRRKACAALIFAILFLMLASQSIQRRHFLPLSLTLPVIAVTPTSRERAEPTRLEVTPRPLSTSPPPTVPDPELEKEPEAAEHKR
ncbi:unnamed protein product, partial [Tetraodon nigroviridis]